VPRKEANSGPGKSKRLDPDLRSKVKEKKVRRRQVRRIAGAHRRSAKKQSTIRVVTGALQGKKGENDGKGKIDARENPRTVTGRKMLRKYDSGPRTVDLKKKEVGPREGYKPPDLNV